LTARALRVLMVAPTSFFSSYGGHIRIAEEADALRALGHSVKVVTYHNGGGWNGLPIERTVSVPWRKDAEVGSSRHKLAFDALLSAKLLRVAQRDKPDVIHAHMHEGTLVSMPAHLLRRCPLVFDFQGSLTSEMVDHRFLNPRGLFYRPARWLEEMINNMPDALIASSRRGMRLLQDDYGCTKRPVTLVPDCVNPDFFCPDAYDAEARACLKRRLGIPSHHKVISYLGLLASYQGTDTLLQAATEITRVRSDVHFLIMGYPGVEQYRARAQQLGVDAFTTFTGKINYLDAPRHLAIGDAAVAPKLSATEGLGKVLNYMAMSLPTVAFDTEVAREYLGDLGVYARAGDAADLARALLSVLDDSARAHDLGEALRARAVRHFSWRDAGERIVGVYRQCLS
jgi:glycosyltransferase involved in cell wall biosynthesis